jgi:DNA-binding NarL/FixJ family response regulator
MGSADLLGTGEAALAAGRWEEARTAFEQALAAEESADAHLGLGFALWWLGATRESVTECAQAYALLRRAGTVDRAVECALWLGITYKADFANHAAGNGWVARAERMLEHLDPGPLHALSMVTRAYRMNDLGAAEKLSERAIELARASGDPDVELAAMTQLGLIRVGKGDTVAGFALIDEAMAAVLGGECTTLTTVVYACCDMLNACELASDIERAAKWCAVADGFVEEYGSPFLYAECRIYHGSVLVAKGRWDEAERELLAGLQTAEGSSPGLHSRGLTRLAGLRVRQGRLEEAESLLTHAGSAVEAENEAALSTAALALARGDGATASRGLEQRMQRLADHRTHLAVALDLLVDAHLSANDLRAAASAAQQLDEAAAAAKSSQIEALAAGAAGRVCAAQGHTDSAVARLDAALKIWSALELPYEVARTRLDLAITLASDQPDVSVDHARVALAGFEKLGASAVADRTAAFLRSAGVSGRSGPKSAGVLTRREHEVLRLLAAGLSNPEIAERLYVSRKTASHHVSSILAKLNLRNRSEAAAYAVATLGMSTGLPSSGE